MTKIKMTRIQALKMSKLFEEIIIGTLEGSTCEYKNGWDDERAAKHVDQSLNRDHAANLRKGLYGVLRTRVSQSETQIDELTKALKALQEYCGKLEWRITLLERRVKDPKDILSNSVSQDALRQ